jgi:hypothetical protein
MRTMMNSIDYSRWWIAIDVSPNLDIASGVVLVSPNEIIEKQQVHDTIYQTIEFFKQLHKRQINLTMWK